MLQKLDTQHLNRLALADALASMKESDFDMRPLATASAAMRCVCFANAGFTLGGGRASSGLAQRYSGFRLNKRESCSLR